MSNNTESDEGSLRTIALALFIAAITIAVFFFPAPPAHAPTDVQRPKEQHIIEHAEAATVEEVTTPKSTPQLVAALVPVCSCESTGEPDNEPQHFASDGVTVIVGKHNPRDVGMCQINLDAHEETLDELGLDAYDRDDNITYANMLYAQSGLEPWRYSEGCWKGHI